MARSDKIGGRHVAGVFKRTGVLEIEDRPEPKNLAEDDVLLEIEGAGVCGSDLHILSDPPGGNRRGDTRTRDGGQNY